MRNRCSVLTDLFLSFAKVGCFTFGGGYSMISVITDTCVEKKKSQIASASWTRAR